jgi:hypothetical protein
MVYLSRYVYSYAFHVYICYMYIYVVLCTGMYVICICVRMKVSARVHYICVYIFRNVYKNFEACNTYFYSVTVCETKVHGVSSYLQM